jgi:uncharacterized protein
MNIDRLNGASKQDLSDRARKLGIAGHGAMKKDDLIKAITRAMKKKEKDQAKITKPVPVPVSVPSGVKKPVPTLNGKHAESASKKPVAASKTHDANGKAKAPAVDPSGKPVVVMDPTGKPPRNLQGLHQKDRILAVVRDPFWLHVYWELTAQSVQRAEYALGQDWHGSKPILRLCDVSSHDTTSTAERIVRDIDIHGGCNNWYVEVTQPPKSYRVDIGYISRRGQFYCLVRSNVVTPPKAGVSDAVDENWADMDAKQADRLYAMSSGFDTASGDTKILKEFIEERLHRPLNAPTISSATLSPPKDRKFFFTIDAEMIVFGRTSPGSRVTIQGEPVKLRPDGTFTMRYSFPDGRQILPAIAESADGHEERKIVLAVERNTKELEPLLHDSNEGT